MFIDKTLTLNFKYFILKSIDCHLSSFRASGKNGSRFVGSTQLLRENVHLLVASADVWPQIIETFLNIVLCVEFVSAPPCCGNEVPAIISGIDHSASESVDSFESVLSERLSGCSQENVQTRGKNID